MGSILVIGSTGNVGGALVAELVRAGETVRAATRNPAALKAPKGAEPVRFDYEDPSTFPSALAGADRVFMIGPPVPEPYDVMAPFLHAVTADGSRRIVLLTAMGTELSDESSLRKVELALQRSAAGLVILRPNWFMDNLHTSWLAPIQEASVLPLPAADSRTSLIDARDIAASAAAVLRTDRFDGRAFTLTGPAALTYAEAAAAVSKAAERDIRYLPVDDESFIKSSVEAGVPEDLAHYLAALFSFSRQGAAAPVSTAVEELTGRSPRTITQYAQDHADAWR